MAAATRLLMLLMMPCCFILAQDADQSPIQMIDGDDSLLGSPSLIESTTFEHVSSSTTHSPRDTTKHHVETPAPVVVSHLVVRKCCPTGQVFSHKHAGCVTSSDWTFSVPIFTLDQYGSFVETNVTRNQVAVETGLLECDQQFQLDVYPDQEPSFQFRVLESGWLWVPEYNMEYRPQHYCLETFVQDAGDRSSAFIMGGAVCVVQEEEPQTFDPDKIPIRKCCHVDMVYEHSAFSCVPRSNLTHEVWHAPITESDAAGVEMVEVHRSKYTNTHEVVTDFQTCSGDDRGDALQLKEGQFYVRASDGYLWLPLLQRFLPPRSYCLEDFYADQTLLPSVYVCLSEPEALTLQRLREPGCQKEPCIPKCCPRYTLLDRAMHTCIPERLPGAELLLHHNNGTPALDTVDADYDIGFPSCSHQYLTSPSERAELLVSGDLRYTSINSDECEQEQVFRVPKGDFCYEQVEDIDGSIVSGAVLCFKEDWRHLGITSTEKEEVNYVYSVFLAISDFFILVSFVVYLTVPDQTQRGLNKNIKLGHSILGRILLCFLFSLFFAYLCLIIIKTASDPINIANPNACIALGACTYVFFMATFFWLNVLCFELWWKCARQESSSSGRRWLWYQLYAWCSPLVFAAVALIMELTPGISNCYIKPKFGAYSCFFSFTRSHNNGAKWAYFFGPVAVLLVADLAFFVLTVRTLLQTVKQSHKGTTQRQTRQRLRLCFKLFLVMGISWVAEIVSFQLGPRTVWYISDVINCFQGFIIFLIFILKPKILESVRTRLCGCCCEASVGHAKSGGTLAFNSFNLSDNTTVSDDFTSSSQGEKPFESSRGKSFGGPRALDHARASPASSSSSSFSVRSIKWSNLDSSASIMARRMAPSFSWQKSRKSEKAIPDTNTSISSLGSPSQSTDSSMGSPSPPLTLSASFLNAHFIPSENYPNFNSTEPPAPSSNASINTRKTSAYSTQTSVAIIPIPRPRSTLSERNRPKANSVCGPPPAIPPRPSLGKETVNNNEYLRSKSCTEKFADLEL
ncbi:uncharacterized protein LOC108681918 isoform X2 [Hyalella azteca]|uniref:Uncharacterized protein LOC108681918 isoform X2 n=1 Tax=Hyalella azteca TaxID=294128 RepID=A0A8B7PJZ1_HYAAZ|nr:uncharacterized protein LOC108681918 isoform X2 [Hyalella azteca]